MGHSEDPPVAGTKSLSRSQLICPRRVYAARFALSIKAAIRIVRLVYWVGERWHSAASRGFFKPTRYEKDSAILPLGGTLFDQGAKTFSGILEIGKFVEEDLHRIANAFAQ